MRYSQASFLFLLVVLAISGSSFSQTSSVQSGQSAQKPQQSDTVRVETELVQLDLVVTDKQGKLISGLQREDFEVFEDSKLQSVSFFTAGTARNPVGWLKPEKKNSAVTLKTDAPFVSVERGRYIVLAVDDFHLTPGNLMNSKAALLRFVREQMISGDQAAIVTTSGALGLLQQFTRERAVLERAINRLTPQTRQTEVSPLDVPRLTEYQAQLIDFGDRDALELAVQEILALDVQSARNQSGGRGGGRGGGAARGEGMTPRERAEVQSRTRARMIVEQTTRVTRDSLTMLEGVIRSLSNLPGRKMVVLFSDGFLLGSGAASRYFDLHRITDAATRSGVVIYSIDTRGLIAAAPGGNASEQSGFSPLHGMRSRIERATFEAMRDGLNALAEDTGGFAVFHNNDFNLGLQRVLDDNESYYVLAYEPETAHRDGRFHKIEVRIRNRPELKVRTRTGYFARDEKAEARVAAKNEEKSRRKSITENAPTVEEAREQRLRTALGSLFPLRDIPVEVTADFVHLPETGSTVVVTARIEAARLNFEIVGDRRQLALDVMVSLFDEQGKAANSLTERIDLSLRQNSFEQVIRNGLQYRKLISLKPGFYEARIAVLESSSAKLGSHTHWVDVPDLNQKKLALSSIFLSSGGSAPQPSASSMTADKTAEQASQWQSRRRFRREGLMSFAIFAYHPADSSLPPDSVIQVQVFAGSRLMYSSPPARMVQSDNTDPRRVSYAAQFPLNAFASGEYELRLLVTDRANKNTAQRAVTFTVE